MDQLQPVAQVHLRSWEAETLCHGRHPHLLFLKCSSMEVLFLLLLFRRKYLVRGKECHWRVR
jgi:hypothetical protein